MKVSKDNKILVYKSDKGKLSIYFNVNGEQYRTTVFPNVGDDMEVRSWGGNIYQNFDEESE